MEEIPGTITGPEIEANKRRLRAQYGTLYDEVSSILFRHDPIGICRETNTDEYEPEVGTILPRLRQAGSAKELSGIIYEEFFRWFNGDDLVGPPSKYDKIAEEIWDAYQKFNSESRSK
jgi:hypothetical protein